MKLKPISIVCVLVGLWMMFGSGVSFDIPWINLPIPSLTPKVTAVTYVYEKDDTAVPNAVLAVINKLNNAGEINANIFEQDTKDGKGEVPEQYKVPLAAAKEAGLPAIVSTAGDKVIKTVKNPQTEAEAEQVVP